MERTHSSFLNTLAWTCGDALLLGVTLKLAQGRSKSRDDRMSGLGPLAESLRNTENLPKPVGNGGSVRSCAELDRNSLDKAIAALEARLGEHAAHVNRRLAEIDAELSLDLKAANRQAAARSQAIEESMARIEGEVRELVSAAHQFVAGEISEIDRKLSVLGEGLPAQLHEMAGAVRQSMEARIALAFTELENRADPVPLEEQYAALRNEVEALSARLADDLDGLVEQQNNETAPLRRALRQLEGELAALRDESPAMIRQIVQPLEASLEARISAGSLQTADRLANLEQALARSRAEMPSRAGFEQLLDERLRRPVEQVAELERKLTIVQVELPAKIKAIIDAVRQLLETRLASELRGIEERASEYSRQAEAKLKEAQAEFRRQLAAESKTPALERSLAKLEAGVAALNSRFESSEARLRDGLASLEQQCAQSAAGMAAELETLRERHSSEINQLEVRWRAETTSALDSAIAGLRQSQEATLSSGLEAFVRYVSLLEARVQDLETKLRESAAETLERAVERVWQVLQARIEQHQKGATPPPAEAQTIGSLRQAAVDSDQAVVDLIAAIGQLFEKPAPRLMCAAPGAAPAAPQPDLPAPPKAQSNPAKVLFLMPRASRARYRIPFVASFLLVGAAVAWLQFM